MPPVGWSVQATTLDWTCNSNREKNKRAYIILAGSNPLQVLHIEGGGYRTELALVSLVGSNVP